MADAPEVDYQGFLAQIAVWPRHDAGQIFELPIHEMNPGHAINAYHALIRWGERVNWDNDGASIRYTPLALALLTQAVGRPVVYEEALGEAPHVDDYIRTDVVPKVGLEDAFDIFVDLHEHLASLDNAHPVTRARALTRAINTQLSKTSST